MKRILFCVVPEKGHVNPCIGPAQHLQAADCEVAFYAPADISAQLEGAGDFTFLGPRETPERHDLSRGASFAANIRDAAWLRRWIHTLLIEYTPAQVDGIRAILRQWRPDVVVIDPLLYASAIAAELEGLPWVAMSNSLNPVLPDTLDSELLATVRWLAPERDRLFARYGIEAHFRGCDILSPHLTLAFTTEDLVGAAPQGVELVGPALPAGARGDEPPFPWERIDAARPLVYMSLGSQLYYQPELFAKVIQATRATSAQLVLSVGELVDTDLLPAGGRACYRRTLRAATGAAAADACVYQPRRCQLGDGSAGVRRSHAAVTVLQRPVPFRVVRRTCGCRVLSGSGTGKRARHRRCHRRSAAPRSAARARGADRRELPARRIGRSCAPDHRTRFRKPPGDSVMSTRSSISPSTSKRSSRARKACTAVAGLLPLSVRLAVKHPLRQILHDGVHDDHVVAWRRESRVAFQLAQHVLVRMRKVEDHHHGRTAIDLFADRRQRRGRARFAFDQHHAMRKPVRLQTRLDLLAQTRLDGDDAAVTGREFQHRRREHNAAARRDARLHDAVGTVAPDQLLNREHVARQMKEALAQPARMKQVVEFGCTRQPFDIDVPHAGRNSLGHDRCNDE